jgi:hypothetical protein
VAECAHSSRLSLCQCILIDSRTAVVLVRHHLTCMLPDWPKVVPSSAPPLVSCLLTTGCFPGQGVYGPVFYSPEVCEECPAGTYAIGGALAPCQPCATTAFEFMTSAPGSRSIADCTCAAGYGATVAQPTVCSQCSIGYFNTGPLQPPQQARALASVSQAPAVPEASSISGTPEFPRPTQSTAHAAAAEQHNSLQEQHSSPHRSLQQVDPVFSRPTYNPCTFCGPGCSTDGPGTTSAQQCSKCQLAAPQRELAKPS